MLSVFLIGVGLSMDAFAVSVTSGLTLKPFYLRYGLWIGFYFGLFQFLMPLLGWLLGSAVRSYVEALGPFISFFLLAFIGGKMLLEGIHADGDTPSESRPEAPGKANVAAIVPLSHPRLLVMAVATSIDALAVGVSFAFMTQFRLVPACALIGCTTFAISFTGAALGSKIPGVSGDRAGILGGLVLVAMGIRFLLTGLFPG